MTTKRPKSDARVTGSSDSAGSIRIRGARQNNLKGIDVEIPIGKLVVVTGPSGSGKSSLAFDTLYAEGQRRYVETFSPYTRQFLDRMDKPRVDELSGTPPAIAIEQVNAVKTSRSTVGSLTEINDYFKLLFPRVAEGRCPQCGRTIVPESAPTIREVLFREFAGEQVHVTFPLAVPPGTQAADFFPFLQGQGYLRVLLFGKLLRTDEGTRIGTLPAYVSVVQDRVLIENANRGRIAEAIEAALRLGGGRMEVVGDRAARRFSSGWHCAECDLEIEPPTPALFSFNHPHGACPRCKGFGRTIAIDYGKVIPDGGLSLEGGAIKPFQTENGRECQRDLLRCAAERGMALTVPWAELSQADRDWVIHGERGADVLAVSDAEELWREGLWYGVAGFFSWLESRAYKMHVRVLLSRYRDYTTCPDCRGGRLRNEARNYRFAGLTFPEWMALPAGRMLDEVLVRLPRDDGRPEVTLARDQLVARLRYLIEVGLPYLSIDRTARTLSGGELQRVNLTTCLGASLTDTLFVLDEPSIGLHSRDTDRLIRILRGLRDLGNTVVVVEHEESVIRAADELLEIGPGRGAHGGELVFQGPCERLIQSARRGHTSSLTGAYLAGTKRIPVPLSRRSPRGFLSVRGARAHNLRSLDIEIPLGVLVCVTGVSGSGKSTLVHEVIFKELGGSTIGATDDGLRVAGGAVFGWDATVGEVVLVDQSPLTRTPKSCTALYLGVFDHIRELLARTPDAQRGGFSAAAFSFNTGVGRCERCSGAGFEKIEMQFLSDVYVRCLECEGQRYQKSVLEVRLNGRNVHEILELTVSDALVAFGGIGSAAMLTPLALMEEVGLGYLTLGQPLNLLSGGESQRVKLVERLARGSGGGDLLILDEPTTGLHFDDVAMLVRLLQRLVDEGNSLLVIEHNLELIKCADHIVDLGPEGGLDGGHLVVQGTPEVVAASGLGYTSRFLRDALAADALGAGDLEAEGLMAAEAHRPVAALQPGRHAIAIRGAREHNLKNIDLDVPRGQLVVITGLSGSGKSTLAFDLLFAEGQRRFMDCMSAYARQFVEQLEKPDVDLLAGLPPTVAIEQRVTRGGGKSTVATVTEVYHFLRLLFAKAGVQWCPDCAVPVDTQTVSAVIAKVEEAARSGRIQLFAALVKGRKGFHTDVARWAVKNGFEWLLVDGAMIRSEDFKPLDRFKEHRIEVLVGERKSPDRVRELVKRALELGKGTVRLMDHRKRSTLLSTERACPVCSRSFDALDPRLFSFNSPHGWCQTCQGFGEVWKASINPRLETAIEQELERERQREGMEEGEARPCPDCRGARLSPVARAVRIGQHTISDFVNCSAADCLTLLTTIKFSGPAAAVAKEIMPEIEQRLRFMGTVGLDYLALTRSAKTLSGGESQRIRLAAQLGSNLRGVLYILDEPTIGLHPRDNARLLDALALLKAKGNSLVVVEHDEETMRRADSIIDLGPGAGREGGRIVAQGSWKQIAAAADSVTGRFIREPLRHPTRSTRRPLDTPEARWIELEGATLHNLADLSVRIPVGRFTVITGVSGSGKSTLMRGIFKPAIAAALSGTAKSRKKTLPGQPWRLVRGTEAIETVYEVDQTPIGKTSRSTPATYIKVFDAIRDVFAQVPLARMRGYTPARFSFNADGGRCETCAGQGVVRVEMQFLPVSYTPCQDCHGRRFNAGTLEVLYSGASIGDVMEMSLEQARDHFAAVPKIHRPLKILCETGLGYLRLGQPSPTLSGGEAQRIKLVSELVRGSARSETAILRRNRKTKSILYLLEEPTIGLHIADVAELLKVLHRLVDDGATVVLIEHHLAIVADADYVIDMGPEAGPAGGTVVATGTPEEIACNPESRTAPYLRELLPAETPLPLARKKRTAGKMRPD